MTTQTQVTWNEPMDQAIIDQIGAKSVEMQDAGKEVAPGVVAEGPGANQKTATRQWVDTAAASEWIAFVEQFNPESAVIV
jgi:hypothetical protein